jgi:hypothetical protein
MAEPFYAHSLPGKTESGWQPLEEHLFPEPLGLVVQSLASQRYIAGSLLGRFTNRILCFRQTAHLCILPLRSACFASLRAFFPYPTGRET